MFRHVILRLAAALILCALAMATDSSSHATPASVPVGRGCAGWVNAGPFHVADSSPFMTENVPNTTVIGAVSALVLRGNVAFIGTVNGGVWRTENIHAAPERLHWSPMFDHQSDVSCTSIAALAQDADAPQRLVAGCGYLVSSSGFGNLNELNGLMQSLDAGLTWQPLNAFPSDLGIASIALRAPSIIIVAVKLEVFGFGSLPTSTQRGVWRSSDGGASWNKCALPGVAVDEATARSSALRLVADPNDSSFLVVATPAGAFVSRDAGASFVAASNGLPVALNTSTVSRADNAVIAIASRSALVGGPLARVIWLGFAACPIFGASCAFAIYRSVDDGASWQSMSEPGTIEASQGGKFFGLGNQGNIHFAMAADPEGLDVRIRCLCLRKFVSIGVSFFFNFVICFAI